MERADWVCSAAASSVACQGEMWTPRRLASERRMPTAGRSGRSDYRRSCGVSVGWKASRSLLIVQLRRSNNVRLPCAVAASPQAVHVGDLWPRRGADVSPVLNDFRHPLSLIYSLAPTYDPSRWTMLKARPAEPKYTLAKGQSGRGLLAPSSPNGVATGRSINEGFRSSDHGFRHSPGRGSCKRGARRFWRSMGRSHGHRGRSVRCELQLFDCRR